MSDSKQLKSVLDKEPKYKNFKDNQFINEYLKKGELIFKDKGKKSIGFTPDFYSLILNRVIDIFNIENKELFTQKFNEATSGDGHELCNMLTIWSSSLCALLCFYSIDKKPIKIQIQDTEYSFDEVHFEFKNKVLKSPSNIDIVLMNRTDKIILFLESKFAEYLDYDKCKISEAYFHYFDLIDDPILIRKLKSKTDNTIYHYGIKQLLTHYIGLDHFTNDEIYDYHKDDERKTIFEFYKSNPGVKIFLQEIVFDNDETKKNEYFANLNKLIKALTWNPKVIVLQPTTYQEVLKNYDGLTENIRKFYKL